MKVKMLFITLIYSGVLFLGTAICQTDISVTFQVDLRIKTAEELFVPGTDNVTVRGSFMSEIGLSGDWFPEEGAILLADSDQDTIYTVTIDIPVANVGLTFEYKFAMNDAVWENDPNRNFTLASTAQILPVVLFDRDSVVSVYATNTLKFTADLTSLYGTGDGYFDPVQDTLWLQGLDWVGATVLSSSEDREFVEYAFSPGIYHCTMVIKGVADDSTKWKTKATPGDRWFNYGWEVTRDKWHTILEDGAIVDVPTFVPDIFPAKPVLSADTDVRFQVNMTNAVNQYTGETIDPSSLTAVGLKGQNEVLGAWGGDWLPADTTAGTMLVLNDGGVNGDLVAADDIWSLLVTFPAGNAGGPSLYKYCGFYPGVDTVNNGVTPLNHEMPPSVDHWLLVSEGSTIEIYDQFGVYKPFSTHSNIPVTFQVDLRIKTAENVFIPGTDNVTIRGSFMSEIGLSGDWFPDEGAILLADSDQDTIYTVTIDIPLVHEDLSFEYKFAINDAVWENDPNRNFTLTGPAQLLPVVLFDRDDVVSVQSTNTLNFTADLTPLYGTGDGYFDPAQDTLWLQGLDWVGATVIGGDREFVEDVFSPGIYHCTMVIKGVTDDSTKWKTKATPGDRWFNYGWEVTRDKWHTILENGAIVYVSTFVPDIFPINPPLSVDTDVRFQVNMTNAVNQYTSEIIDPSSLIFVGLKGQNDVLGAWGGDWLPADTANGTMLVLNDGGVNGDLVAADDIWSLLVTFPAGNAGGPSLYKYCGFYPGADTVNNGVNPLNHEMPPSVDHWLLVSEGPTMEIYDYFGVYEPFTVSIDKYDNVIPSQFELGQNYPNPFNPTTMIHYSIPHNGLTSTLRVYNVLGQEVVRLKNDNKTAGVYKVTFDGSLIASGIYFYTLTVGEDVIATRKMMLVK